MAADTVLIVGGGLSGLTTAFYLGKAGTPSIIIEKASRLGGLIKTDRVQNCDLEAGAESFIATKTAVAELAADLGGGLSQEIVGSNDSARRVFVARKGRLIPLPRAMSMMVPAQWVPALRSPLFSPRAKLQFIRERFTRPRKRDGDFSVGELIRDHFGEELLDYITEPLLSGVYGGESAVLSARSVLPRFVAFEERYGSLIEGVRRAARQPQEASLFRSFKGGMQTLIDALTRAVHEHSSVIFSEATKAERVGDGWRVRLGAESISGRRIVLACPAWVAAKLLEQTLPNLALELAAIPYSSSILAVQLFEQASIAHPLNGFGFLVPPKEQTTIAAATWVNTKFPERVSPGLVALRGFIVSRKAEALAEAQDDQILKNVRKDFETFMGISSRPIYEALHHWPRSMPQYTVGHEARVARIESMLALQPGLTLTGNYFDGVGMPDSIRRAKQAAKHIRESSV